MPIWTFPRAIVSSATCGRESVEVVSVCPIIFPIIGEHVSTQAYRFGMLHVSE
jgi:hypothetical protein